MCIFFFNDTATTEIYTLSLHDALPICVGCEDRPGRRRAIKLAEQLELDLGAFGRRLHEEFCVGRAVERGRSEEHTSELQSHLNLVCRLLLEKKKEED